jgi:hypothetical protein
MSAIFTSLVHNRRTQRGAGPGYGQDSLASCFAAGVARLPRMYPLCDRGRSHTDASEPRGEVPDPHLRRQVGSAELTPEQLDWMMKALWRRLRRRWSPGPARASGRRPVAHSDGHPGPHDAAGEQTTTDGPFVRAEGGGGGCSSGLVSCPGVASNSRCGRFSTSRIRDG